MSSNSKVEKSSKLRKSDKDEVKKKRKPVETQESFVEAQTQAEVDEEQKKRRKLRTEQGGLLETIGENKSQLEDFNSDLYQTLRMKNNEIYEKVGHTREGAVDAAINLELVHALYKRSEKLDDLSRRIHFDDFAISLTKNFRCDGVFNWRALGQDVGKLFMRPTPLTSMLGTLDKPEKVRIAAQRRVKETFEEVRPETIIQESKVGADGAEEEENNEATWARISSQSTKMAQMTKNSHINMFKFLVDERDHVQTIENFFDFAFLVKNKVTEFVEDSTDKQPKLKHQTPEEMASENRDSQQLVISLNMKDVKRLAQLLKKDGNVCPLHRHDELYEANNAAEQADILARQVKKKLDESAVVQAERRTQKMQASQAQSSQAATQPSKKNTGRK